MPGKPTCAARRTRSTGARICRSRKEFGSTPASEAFCEIRQAPPRAILCLTRERHRCSLPRMRNARMLHSALQLSRRGYANARRWLEKVFYDRARGIDTADAVTLDSLGLAAEHRQDYHATPWPMLERALSQLEVRDHDVLIDFGCGNGRVVVAAAMRPFRRVIGVELSPELAESARANVESARPNLRCQDVSIVVTDAMRYEIPD